MKKQPEITDATRNILIAVFCDFYAVRPIEKITVKEITEKAGYSRATFYNYFKDTYDLLEHIENAFISTLMETITQNIEKNRIMDDFMSTFAQLLQSNRSHIDLFIGSSHRSAFVDRLKREVTPILLTAFHVSSDNLKARYAMEFYISGLIPTMGAWLKRNQDLPVEKFAELIKGILQEGVLKQLES